jgi:cytochrome bd ubiquinol oxidase subunit II
MGAAWLVMKTEGPLQEKARAWTLWGLGWGALGVGLVSVATPMVSETVRERWFSFPRLVLLSPLPLLTLVAGIFILKSLKGSDWKPFAGAVAIFALAFAGLAYSLFPYVVLDRMTIWQAAAHSSALEFLFAGTAFVLPFIVAYNVAAQWIFRGKAKAGLYDH